MTTLKEWVETEEWVHAQLELIHGGKPLTLPNAELAAFMNCFFKRFKVLTGASSGPLFNRPDVRLLWWCWLNLDPAQQTYMRKHDVDDIIGQATDRVAVHATELEIMKDPNRRHEYWKPDHFIYLVHGVRVTHIQRMQDTAVTKTLTEFFRARTSG